ncbi:VanZ family protein [Variovorax sp. RB2P76]|uniref:VanZ family protein n=1 Tax=Variovorax sp. RB2P76 TaxID=3443736 RepID=UPI003F467FE4
MKLLVQLAAKAALWRWLLLVAMLVLLVLCLVHVPPQVPNTGWDKSNHALAFAVLAFFGNRAWPGRSVLVLLGLLAYGGLIEVLQSFTPSRFAEWSDLLADGVGLLLGEAVARLVWRLVPLA